MKNITLMVSMILTLAVALMAQSVTPVLVTGNPTCRDISPTLSNELRIDPPTSGTYTVNSVGTVTLDLTSDSTMNWSNTPNFIKVVIVKGGPNANVYSYSPSVAGDVNLTTPTNNGNTVAISHVSFCYQLRTTAASVYVSGRVYGNEGYPLPNTRISVVDLANGNAYPALTNNFGYYTVQGLPVGNAYLVTAMAKGNIFTEQTISLQDSLDGLDFYAN